MQPPMQPSTQTPGDEAEPTEEAPAAEAQESDGYTICLKCKADGSFEVYKETEHDDASPMPMGAGESGMPTPSPAMGGGGEAPAEQPETADNLEDALKLIVRLHKQNPMDQSYAGQMSAGFAGENRTPY